MDIAILSDIHGNYVAFEECIKHALERGITTFLFLGDYVGELADPERAMKMLHDLQKEYNCVCVKGNKEDYWIDYRNKSDDDYVWEDNNSTTGMMLYAYNHLTKEDIDFFETLPIMQKIEIEEYPPFIICHGSPYSNNEKMIPDTERIKEIMDSVEEELIICGHSHKASKMIHNGKVVLNAGSVGIPFLSEGKTQYLILHGSENGWEEEFINLEYNIEAVIADMQEDNLHIHAPYWNYSTERLLRDGKISNTTVLVKAMNMCKKELGECNWPIIPEKYWEQAVKEIYG